MKVQVKMGISADDLFESIVTSVLYDAEQARGKKVPAKKLKAGFTYQKTLNAKLGGAQHVTTKITEFEPPRLYAASITSSRGVNTVRYEIEPIEGQDAISVVYEEGYEGDKTSTTSTASSWALCTAPLPSVKSRSVCVTWRPTSRRTALPSETTSPIRYPPTANCRRRAKVRLSTPRRARNNMEDMNKIEMACFEIIANVGSARSCFIEAIDLAGEGKIDEAEARVVEGEQFFLVGHAKHGEMIAQEACGDHIDPSIILIHAEDQLMSAETFKILAGKFIDLAKKNA